MADRQPAGSDPRPAAGSASGWGRLLSIVRGEGGKQSRIFELSSQVAIVASLVTLSLETMQSLSESQLWFIERLDTLIVVFFAAEYGLRIAAARNKRAYIFSIWGIIDFLAVVPTILLAGVDLKMIRALLFLRLVRLLKLGRYNTGLQRLIRAFSAILPEMMLFFAASLVLLFLAASCIYFLEREAQPDVFTSIPAALWWAVATFTTVGYGDIYPVTPGGKIFASIIVLVYLCLVGVPAGLFAAALVAETKDLHLPPDGER